MLEIATRALSRDRQTGETGFLWNLISPMQFAEIDFGPDLNVVVKFEGSNPGGSIKLKTALALVANCEAAGRLRPNGHVIESSSGNLGIALAMVCANRGYKFTCVVDPNAAKDSLALIRALGGNLVVVSEKDANGGYLRSTAINPLMTEGKKTAAYEICEQLAWRAPEAVFVGVGDGSIIGGLHKGFSDLRALGWIGAMPRIFGVQVAGSNFLYRAWGQQIPLDQVERRSACSIADSLQAEVPQDRFKALDAVTKTAGAYVEVSDDQVLEAMRLMARCGYLVEPAAAAACAGVIRARQQDLLGGRSDAVILRTGNGLKDIFSLRRMIAMPSIPK